MASRFFRERERGRGREGNGAGGRAREGAECLRNESLILKWSLAGA